MHTDLTATAFVVLSGLFGTGGGGYALIQWWGKRNDPTSRADAARILTDAAAGIVIELRNEKKQLLEEVGQLRHELDDLKKTTLQLLRFLTSIATKLEDADAVNAWVQIKDAEAKL